MTLQLSILNRISRKRPQLTTPICPQIVRPGLSNKHAKPCIITGTGRVSINFKYLNVVAAKDGTRNRQIHDRLAFRSSKADSDERVYGHGNGFQNGLPSKTLRMVSANSLTATGFINKALMPMAVAFSFDIFLL